MTDGGGERPLRRIAVVNRGEPAMRLINAARERSLETGTDITTISLYTEPDQRAMFVREADEAWCLGPATSVDADGHRRITYLDLDLLERALVETEADAAWVGWGFVAEDARFVDLCDRLGVTFIGPSAEVMRRLGDKITSKQIAEAAGVPVAPWSGGPVDTSEHAHDVAERIGFPLLVKATAGGGGRGIRRVENPGELASAIESARVEARGAFGNDAVFLERLVTGARHIEVQMIGDDAGTVWPVGVRDCSVQRRNQKLLEEAPSPSLDADQHVEVLEAAARLGRAAGYRNAGTVEFLYEPADRSFSFMEVNARLQVEHPITELTTGVDMVKLQLHVAGGGLLDGDAPPPTVGHAIEARVNAEDPEQGFAPSPGRIDVLRFPTGPGLRIDTGVEEGDEIAPEFDSMIAKVIATGRTREEATARLRRALEQTEIVIHDGTSNTAFLHEMLGRSEWAGAEIDVAWVDRLAASEGVASRFGEVALLAAAIDAHRTVRAVETAAFRASAVRGRPEIDARLTRTIELRHRGRSHAMDVRRLGPGDYRITVDGHRIAVHRDEVGRARTVLTVAGERYRIVSAVHGITHFVDVEGQPHRIVHDEGGVVRSPAPAVVVAIDVEVGERVEVGDRLAVIEAMKMETSLTAEFAGVVQSIDVNHNEQVDTGARLLVVEPDDDAPATIGKAPTLSFAEFAHDEPSHHDRCAHWLHAIRQLLLGYDLEPADVTALGRGGGDPCNDELDASEHLRMENEVLQIFSDLVSLFGREADDEDEPLLRHGTEGYLFEYLRRVENMAEDFPASFVARLQRTLSHFGVDRLDPSPDLDTALARIVRSHQRMDRQIGVVVHLLERRLDQPAKVAGAEGDARRALLDDVARASRADHPAVHDLAREVIYREFDEPFLAERRWQLLEEAETHLDALEAVDDPTERAVHVAALVDCPQPLKTLLSKRFVEGSARLRAGLLEVMTRRYYRIRELGDVAAHELDGLTVVTAAYHRDGRDVRVAAIHVERDELRFGAEVIDRMLATTGEGNVDHVLDVYLWSSEPVTDAEAILAEVAGTLDDVLGERQLHRIAVAIADPTSDAAALAGRSMRSRTRHVTLRPAGDGRYEAQPLSRDLHPMMAKRLELWRLDNFDVTRVDSPDDVYLYHGTARENRRDERLFAIAEVRDLTAIRDDDGRLLRLPELERIVHEVAGSIRRFQAQRPAGKRLGWNRILLYLWPRLDLTSGEIAELVARLAPAVEGLGLQKVQVLARVELPTGRFALRVLELTDPVGTDPQVTIREPSTQRIRPLGRHEQNVVRLRQRGLVDPYELLRTVAPSGQAARRGIPPGEFQEYDLVGDPDDSDAAPRLVPVDREPGSNTANIVVAVVTNRTERYPDGMRRVAIVGDPSRGMGNLAEAECRRINAALDLAEEMGVPAEWYAVSAGAKIAMDSGSENMDWISATLRRIIEFTQAGHHLNVVVTGISVGAQPYWNAEATMLMHTKGVLIMVPTSAMVLTGKDALDYSGGVSAEDNLGIGGYERVMGPNGQAQFLAHDVVDACRLLLQHHDFTWSEPGERFPRRAVTTDPVDRDIRSMPHGGEFPTLAELFSEQTNPGRKKPFEMRRVMEAVVDQDAATMERWFAMADAEVPIVWNARIGGHSVSLLGFEAQNLPRPGIVPADGPTRWTSSTLFPKGSKKVARAINATSANRPLVVLASLSGFDGSPESMRTWQLEFGAEIGRAVVNFDGPIVFCVVSRYHGGAFVVFSGALNDHMEVAALEGSHASVIGGAPAAAVVFARDVDQRTDADARMVELRDAVAAAAPADRARLAAEMATARERIRADKLGEVAAEFDHIHDVHRALAVGSIDRIIPPGELRPYLVDAIERGVERTLARG